MLGVLELAGKGSGFLRRREAGYLPSNGDVHVGERLIRQLGLRPGDTAVAGDIGDQTERALANLAAILEAAGSAMSQLVKTTIFYADVEDFAALNQVYARHMPDPPPARSAPANVRLPRGLLVSIDAIALLLPG